MYAAGKERDRHGVRSRDISPERAAHSDGDAQGLPVSLSGFLQDQLVQCKIGDSPLEPPILLLKCLEATGLLNLQPTVFFPSTVIALLQHANPPAHFANCLTLSQVQIRLAEMVNDLLDRKSLPGHPFCSPSLRPRCNS